MPRLRDMMRARGRLQSGMRKPKPAPAPSQGGGIKTKIAKPVVQRGPQSGGPKPKPPKAPSKQPVGPGVGMGTRPKPKPQPRPKPAIGGGRRRAAERGTKAPVPRRPKKRNPRSVARRARRRASRGL